MVTASDQTARQEALNPEYSYIVQAPAGSGKTELLTQRFLKLLTRVKQPESIVALTFTKKAAHEMRERILSAIEKVHHGEKNKQPETNLLAQQALECDKQHHWQLLQHPHRLRVQTIDSLCASLVNQMPLLSQGGGISITDNAEKDYLEAAERCLFQGAQHSSQHPEYQSALRTLLLHVGNHQERCIQLLADMLSWREQWLPYVLEAHEVSAPARERLEKALQQISDDAVMTLEQCFPEEIKSRLKRLIEFSEIHGNQKNELFWNASATLLLTKEYSWRARVDKNLGFPSPSSTKNLEEKALFTEMKSDIEDLLDNLRTGSSTSHITKSIDPRQALENYLRRPPTTYSDTQWNIIQALMTILPFLSAQLAILYQEKQTTDFTEVAARASLALGEEDNPTELALYLDYQIQHLLIDEFQDTSLKQFQLIEKLTQGWLPDDGRTLFIVGDPMQSIYRFREADVSLFLKACQFGIGNISLKYLALSRNFRSHPELIEWVNRCFQSIFPAQDDLVFSAVSHHASQAGRSAETSPEARIHFHRAETPEEQAQYLIEKIQPIPANETIAILVRSRNQLKSLLPSLKAAHIDFQSMDMDSLSTQACIQDLYSLTQCLLQPANRLAWLSVLRAPWCGLTLDDLLRVTESMPLSIDGQQRFDKVSHILNHAWQQQQKQPLALWVETTWRQLDGHWCIHQKNKLDIERFWELLDTYQWDDFDILNDLSQRLEKLFSNTPTESRLQIMTIHKSKGLEFDHVFLPHLETAAAQQDSPLLQHLAYYSTQKNQPRHLILATLKSIDTQQDAIYRYLQHIEKRKDYFERQRLLYVALTRAKLQIHCSAVVPESKSNAPSGSFLQWLEDFLPNTHCRHPSKLIMDTPKIENKTGHLYHSIQRLPSSYFLDTPVSNISQTLLDTHKTYLTNLDTYISAKKPQKTWIQLTGTFIHEQIQHYANHCANNNLLHSLDTLNSWLKNQAKFWKKRLREIGVQISEEQEKTELYTRNALGNFCTDPRGQWILAPHSQAKNEWELMVLDTYISPATSKTIIIDRTFIDDTQEYKSRWIIDYKMTEESASLPSGELSVNQAPQAYREQLENYAQYLSVMDSTLPIFLGLYYPLTCTWIAWKWSI